MTNVHNGAGPVNWLSDLRAQPIAPLAAQLGIATGARSTLACPACNVAQRSRGDRRGPVGLTRTGCGWRCHRCGAGGSGVDLAAYAVLGRLPLRGDSAGWAELRTALDGRGLTVAPAPAPSEPAPRSYPPEDELRDLLGLSRPASADPEVSGWLASRLGAAADTAVLDRLVVALPSDVAGPAWASFGEAPRGRPWGRAGYRALLPLYDATGRSRSVRARRVRPAPPPREGARPLPKALPPVGYETAGLVMADPVGRLLLETGALPTWWAEGRRFVVVVAEGEPAFLAWACARRGNGAVLGVMSGGWSPNIAGRIPAEAAVVIATDHDKTGDRYAEGIAATLAGRVRSVRRWTQGKDEVARG